MDGVKGKQSVRALAGIVRCARLCPLQCLSVLPMRTARLQVLRGEEPEGLPEEEEDDQDFELNLDNWILGEEDAPGVNGVTRTVTPV